MTVLLLMTGAILGAGIGWWLATQKALCQLDQVQAKLRRESRYWQESAERARAEVARLAKEAETWQAGCKQGREDVISIMPLLLATTQQRKDQAPGVQANDCG
jgi:hypothetical protein